MDKFGEGSIPDTLPSHFISLKQAKEEEEKI